MFSMRPIGAKWHAGRKFVLCNVFSASSVSPITLGGGPSKAERTMELQRKQ